MIVLIRSAEASNRYAELQAKAGALELQARAIQQCRAEIRQLGQRIREADDVDLRERAETILPDGRTARITSIERLIASFRDLIDVLGIATLIIGDLDATESVKITDKNGHETTRWKSARPELGKGQQTANSVLKDWHPGMKLIDELAALPAADHATSSEGYDLYVAYQKPISAELDGAAPSTVIPRTFEDALILTNTAAMADVEGSSTSAKVKAIVGQGLSGPDLADELFDLLKTAEKAAFALDCLMLTNPKALKPPAYIADGLKWFETAVGKEIAESELKAGTVND